VIISIIWDGFVPQDRDEPEIPSAYCVQPFATKAVWIGEKSIFDGFYPISPDLKG
jgi:hypothetical protein